MRPRVRSLPPELLEQLWSDPKARSRNQNFSRFRDDTTYRAAVKHIRSMLAFRQDLIRFRGQSDVAVKWLGPEDSAEITIHVPGLHLRRSLFVSKRELELLERDPAWEEAEVALCDDSAIGRDRKQ